MATVITKWDKFDARIQRKVSIIGNLDRFDIWIIKKGKRYYKVGQICCMKHKEGQVLLQSGTGLLHAL